MAELVVFVRSRPFFGAQLVMFPALYQLKQWWPDKRLRVVARDPLAPVFEALPWVDEFVLATSVREELAAIGPACETYVSLHPSSELHGLAGMLRRPARRLGFRNRRVCDWAWTHAVPFDATEYRCLHFLRLLSRLQPVDCLAAARDCVAALAHACVDAAPPSAATHTVTLMPGGGAGEFKKWGLERYLALADALGSQGDIHFNILLGPAEAAEAARLRDAGRADISTLIEPSLPALAAAIMRSDLVVANDCGPSHLAQCSGVPFIGLFDADKPEWFWRRPGARCLLPESGQPLSSVPVATVYEACLSALAGDMPAP